MIYLIKKLKYINYNDFFFPQKKKKEMNKEIFNHIELSFIYISYK